MLIAAVVHRPNLHLWVCVFVCYTQEEAKLKFQAIQKAYDSLMTTSEDDIIEQLADKSAAEDPAQNA